LQEMYEDASQIANDAVGSIRIVASFCAEEKVMQLYGEKCEGPVKESIKESLISGIGYGIANFLLYNVYATTIYAGAQLVKKDKATYEDVFRVNKPSITIVSFSKYFKTSRKNLKEIHSTKLSFDLF
jgi:ATP-binding cassette subfamily B (MDR/TAP) protein 1